jgi:hypothetical protein
MPSDAPIKTHALGRLLDHHFMTEEREALIKAIWSERGQNLWNPATNGRGQPLRLQNGENPNDILEYGLVIVPTFGRSLPAVACEGVVVATSPKYFASA